MDLLAAMFLGTFIAVPAECLVILALHPNAGEALASGVLVTTLSVMLAMRFVNR